MKRLIQSLTLTALIFLTPFCAFADCQITLQWSAITGPDLAGYRLYMRTEFSQYDYDNFEWQGSEHQCTIPELDENTVYYFTIRVFDNENNESADSNEVRFAYEELTIPNEGDSPIPNEGDSPIPNDSTPPSSPGGRSDPGAGSGSGCFIASLVNF